MLIIIAYNKRKRTLMRDPLDLSKIPAQADKYYKSSLSFTWPQAVDLYVTSSSEVTIGGYTKELCTCS